MVAMAPFTSRVLVALLATAALTSSSCRKPAPSAGSPPAAGATAQPSAPAPPPATAAGTPAAAAPAPPKPMPAQLPDVLARVNGEPVERWEFDNAVKRLEARAGGSIPAERRDEILRGVLDQLVAYHLLAQEARGRKFAAADQDVETRVAEIRKNFPDEGAFTQAMAAQGLTVDHLRAQTRTNLEVQKIIDAEVSSKVAVQDSDVSAFYQQNLGRFKQGESVHASHILIAVPQGATPEQKAAAKAKATAALKQVRGGADFAVVARAQSQDPGSAPNGGDLGFFPRGQMTPAFEEAAFKLKAGAVSNIVETPFGFHIIKALGRRPARTAPLDEVSGQIKEFLTQGQREQKLEQFIAQAKSKSKLEVLV
jgi:peptidyl-prolyl cis-trans isomerase C